MVRTQMYLTRLQHVALKREARRRRISMTELLRRIVADRLAGGRKASRFQKEDVLAFVALGSSGRRDIAERHDEILDESLRGEGIR